MYAHVPLPPQGQRRALGIIIWCGLRGALFPMSEVPLYEDDLSLPPAQQLVFDLEAIVNGSKVKSQLGLFSARRMNIHRTYDVGP